MRVIAATHRDLEAAIQERLFREDLFYGINVVAITLPPLRERLEDIPAFGRIFPAPIPCRARGKTPAIQPDVLDFLQQQPGPGNVRELENVARKALLAVRGYTIMLVDLREVMREPKSESTPNVRRSANRLRNS